MSMSKRYSDQEKQKLIEVVLTELIENSTAGACGKAGVANATFLGWVAADSDLAERYALARTLYPEFLVERIKTLAKEQVKLDDRGRTDSGRVQQIRVEIDALKWILSKIMPKRYGDRLTLAGDEEQPLTVVKVERTVVDKRKEVDDSG